MRGEKKRRRLSDSAASGIVALIFLVLGFQLALFVEKVVRRPAPDDSCRVSESPPGGTAGAADSVICASVPARTGKHAHSAAESVHPAFRGYPRPDAAPHRTVESFPFDPNDVTTAELVRLGLTERQAGVIENYRSKGGRFRRKSDFAKMYVVSDSLYARLEPFIEIPKVELNGADSAALVSLKGIGPYFAGKIMEYRDRLGGFVEIGQLLEIERFGQERFDEIADCVEIDASAVRRLDLWRADEETLSSHPYVGKRPARSIVLFRNVYDSSRWTLDNLVTEKILTPEMVEKLKKYVTLQVI